MSEPEKTAKSAPTDYSLLLSRIESALLSGRDAENHKGVLINRKIRDALSPDQLLTWAELCQMAGIMETALSTYDRIHETAPDMAEAWERHLDLLLILNKKNEAASILSRAARRLTPERHGIWIERCRASGSNNTDKDDVISAAAPFEKMRKERDAINLFFQGEAMSLLGNGRIEKPIGRAMYRYGGP